MRKQLFVLYFLFFVLASAFPQSDSTFWNREFHFGTTVFLDRKDLPFYDYGGHYFPGYSASYAFKKINGNGKGIIFNAGVNTFGWKSDESDYQEFLGENFLPVKRAVDYSHFKYTFSHLAFGFYYRKTFPDFYIETDVSPGMQLLNFSRFRDIRNYITGATVNLRDDQFLNLHIIPSLEINTRLARRVGTRHLLFVNLKYLGFFDIKPFNYYSFLAINLGVSKDFVLKKRKLRNGKKHRDNYIFADVTGLDPMYSLNYERNVSPFENFRLNIRFGGGYALNYFILGGVNMVLGHRYDRFESGFTYYFLPENNSGEKENLLAPYLAYRWESPKNWLFRLHAGPAVRIANETNSYFFVVGVSLGKRFGKK